MTEDVLLRKALKFLELMLDLELCDRCDTNLYYASKYGIAPEDEIFDAVRERAIQFIKEEKEKLI